MAKKTRRQLYAYLGGGSLTVANCDVAQPIVRCADNKTIAAAVLVAASLLTQTSPDGHDVSFNPDLFLVNDWAINEDKLAAAALDKCEVVATPPHDAERQLVDGCTTMRRIMYHTLGFCDRPPSPSHVATQKLQEWVSSLLGTSGTLGLII